MLEGREDLLSPRDGKMRGSAGAWSQGPGSQAGLAHPILTGWAWRRLSGGPSMNGGFLCTPTVHQGPSSKRDLIPLSGQPDRWLGLSLHHR